jgi:hypothetical protein
MHACVCAEEKAKNSPPTKSLEDMKRAPVKRAGAARVEALLVKAVCLRRLPSLLKAAMEED